MAARKRKSRRGRKPSAKAKKAYYSLVKKSYNRLKKVAKAHGFE